MIAALWWWLHTHPGGLTRVVSRLLQLVCGASIDAGTRFAGRPCLPHGLHGIFISGDARIGKDCVIFQSVTIGSNTLADSRRGAPTLGDGCYIGAGACIIGPVTLGACVRVGANTTVARDLPANCVAVSGAPRIIEKAGPLDNRYRTRRDGIWYVFENGAFHRE